VIDYHHLGVFGIELITREFGQSIEPASILRIQLQRQVYASGVRGGFELSVGVEMIGDDTLRHFLYGLRHRFLCRELASKHFVQTAHRGMSQEPLVCGVPRFCASIVRRERLLSAGRSRRANLTALGYGQSKQSADGENDVASDRHYRCK